MKTINRFLIVLFAICIIAYLITDLFFKDAIIYLIGGALGTLLKPVGLQEGFYIPWLIILIGIVVLYQKINSNVLKWAFLILIWILLYLVDIALYEILPDIKSSAATYLHIGLSAPIKSGLLTWSYYRGNK